MLNLDYGLYFNLLFVAMLAFGMLIGFLRGMKKSIYSFLVKLVFVAFFFLTLDMVVNTLWTINLPFLGGIIGGFIPAAASATSLSEAIPLVLQSILGDDFAATLTNQEFLDFIGGLAIFVLKIVYMILYFSVIQVFYRLIMFIVRIIIFSKSQKSMAGRSVGSVFGGLSALISIYVTIIMLGGVMSISDSLVNLVDSHQEYNYLKSQRNIIYDDHLGEIKPLNETIPGGQNLDEAVDMLKDFVTGYNANVFVQLASYVTLEDENTGQETVLNIYLFDSVFSFNYREQQISFRKELVIMADMASLILSTDYMETEDLSDLTGDDVRNVFGKLSESDLFAVLIPLVVEVGADYLETDIQVPREELYAIDWATEINQMGLVAGTLFDIINAAGVLNDNFDLEQATFDGDQFELLFDHLADSDLITLGAYVALEPLLKQMSEDMALIITVPADLTDEDTWRESWADEFRGFGEIVKAILDTDVTYGELSSGEPMTLISALSQFDFTKLLDSQIISYALINILDGTAGIEGLDMIVVGDDVIWLDSYDETTGDLIPGELRNIMVSFNQLAQLAQTIDFDDLDIAAILKISMEDIDIILESKLLAQTFGYMLMQLTEENDILVIPRLVIEEITVKSEIREIVTKTEIRALFAAVFTLEIDDLENLDFDPSILKRLADSEDETQLDLEKRDDLFGSHIIHATISKFILDLNEGENQTLTVPYVDETNNPIRHYKNPLGEVVQVIVPGHDTEYISIEEFTAILEAILVLDFDNFDDIANIDINRIIENIDSLLESAILHATVSNLLIDATADNDTIVVPFMSQDETVEVRVTAGDPGKETEYIARAELESIFNALDILEISLDDFEGEFDFNLEKLSEENDDITPVLDSAIIHATISKIMINQRENDTIILPERGLIDDTENDRAILVTNTTGDEYVIKEEIQAIINGLIILGLTDFDSFDGGFNLGALMEDDNASIILKSAVVHATITRTFLDLASETVVIPDLDANGDSIYSSITAYLLEDETPQPYILKQEIYAIIDVLEVLGFGDTSLDDEFNLDLKLENVFGENKTILLNSAVIHATITKQLYNLSGDVIMIPEVDSNGEEILLTVTAYTETIDEGLVTEEIVEIKYIKEDEIYALLDVLELLGLGEASLDNFDINIELSVLFDQDGVAPEDQNKVTFMDSAVIHATITKQLLGLGTDVLVIPEVDTDGVSIRSLHTAFEDEDGPRRYITKDEVYALIDILEILGLGDSSLDNFDINIELSVLFGETGGTPNKTIFLESASIHATITKQLVELGQATLVIPDVDAQGNTVRSDFIAYTQVIIDDILLTEEEIDHEYITKAEVEALIDVLELLGLGDQSLDNFNIDIKLSVLFEETEGVANKTTFLESASIHATITKQLVELGEETLLIPDVDADGVALRTNFIAYKDASDVEHEYIIKAEIEALIDVLDLLGLGAQSLDNFNIDIKLSVLFEETEGVANKTTFLESASIHATITKQLVELGQATLVIPDVDAQGNTIRSNFIAYTQVIIDDILLTEEEIDHEYITKAEIEALIDVLDLLGLGAQSLDNFNIDIKLSVLFEETEGVANKDIFLESASIHATITKQLIELGQETLVIPEVDTNNVSIRSTSIAYTEIINAGLPTEETVNRRYITKAEVKALIDVLEILGLGTSSLDNFDISIEIGILFDDPLILDPAEQNKVKFLNSALIHATITKQLLDLGDAILVVPDVDSAGDSIRSTSVAYQDELAKDYYYIIKNEIYAIIDVLEILELDNATLDNFTVDIRLDYFFDDPLKTNPQENKEKLLASAAIHATVTKQMLDLGDNILAVPEKDSTGTTVRTTSTAYTDALDNARRYIVKNEIYALIDVLEILGLGNQNLGEFDGVISLDNLYGSLENQQKLLNSSAIHATITKQMNDIKDQGHLIIPDRNFSDTADLTIIQSTTFFAGEPEEETVTDTYILKTEIYALIDALEILGVDDITNFTAEFTLSLLDEETKQDTLLTSTSIHATISDRILGLGTAVLIVPEYEQDGTTLVRTTVSATEYIVIGEIKAILNAFNALEDPQGQPYDNLDSFGTGLNSEQFFAQRVLLLESASIQAKLSNMMLNDTGGNLIIPDENPNTLAAIRIPISGGVTYVEKAEILAILDALELIGLTDFDNLNFTPQVIFTVNFNDLLESVSMQATISDVVLENALDETALAGSATLIVPSSLRETITVNALSEEQVEKTELIKLLEALKELDINDFDGNMNASAITSLTEVQLNTMVESGSVHITLDNMFKGNTFITDNAPDLAIVASLHGVNNVIEDFEIVAFILAAQQVSGSDFTNVSFNLTAVTNLTPAQREIVLNSMIVRNAITPDIETLVTFDPGYSLDNTDYEENDTNTFLRKQAILDYIAYAG